jgi:uncharacterized protein (TIGR00255 family)
MICSMTAFARFDRQENWGQICWELRSVNHRYLDICIRLPDDFRRLEIIIREHIQQYLKRGKVDCTLYFQANQNENVKLHINQTLAQQLCQATEDINKLTGNRSLPNALDILRWPGVLETETVDVETISETIIMVFQNALEQLIGHREREGAQLAAFIEQRCTAILDQIEQIRNELPMILQTQRERLEKRLTELVEVNSERLEQEMIVLAQKMDVAEELDRIETHIAEIRKIVSEKKVVGRRLDFLVQELHREANTLGAKSNHINTSHHAIELKVLIEQMREQTQNIE